MVRLYTHPDHLGHVTPPGHPEQVARLHAVDRGLHGMALDRIACPLGDLADLHRCHPPAHVESLRRAVPTQGWTALDGDTFLSPGSWTAALRAVGGICAAVDAVVTQGGRAFVAARPPGHHAEASRAMGFCLFGTVAIGAMRALDHHGLSRVAVLDFDVHHGNGTEDIFKGNDKVLMCSIFQHPFYPYSGAENPAANMCNIPLPAGSGSDEFRAAITDCWLPRLHEFRPQMVFISAGFDAHYEDDMGSMKLFEQDYAFATRQMVEIAALYSEKRIVSMLEGGYVLSALARSVAAHLRVLAEI